MRTPEALKEEAQEAQTPLGVATPPRGLLFLPPSPPNEQMQQVRKKVEEKIHELTLCGTSTS
jgi:hypothetical protein